MTTEMKGKVVLLTGGTEGIGKAAAVGIAGKGATLVLVGRNPEKTERVVAEVKAASGNPDVHSIIADLSTLAGIRGAAAAFRARHERLDVLANNAGGLFMEHHLTVDGFEQTFALNHLSYFLLTHELRDLLVKTPGARVISTSSGAHRAARLKLDQVVKRPDGSAGFPVYGDSKAMNILFTRELARRLQGTGVTANCFHPGWVNTGFGLNNEGFVGRIIGLSAPLLARTPEKGAESLVWLATSPDAAKLNGEYVFNCRPARTTALAKDDTLAAALWRLSEQVCGLG